MFKYFLLIEFSLIYTLSALADATMRVSPQVVPYGERIQLILSDNKPIQNTPNLNQLQKDFTVRGQQQMQNTSIINGVRNETHQLILSLYPKHKGNLTIGPLDWNGTQLPAVQIQVTDASQYTNRVHDQQMEGALPNASVSMQHPITNRIFSAEALLQPAEIYEGESTLYIVRITENIGLSQAQIQTPDNTAYTLTLFGQDTMRETTHNGQAARVYERIFVLTPTETGPIQIDAAGVLGLIPDTSNPNPHPFRGIPDMFGHDDFFNQAFGVPQKEVYIGTDNVTLTVKPKPSDWNGWWLPSRNVTLKEQYKMPAVVTVGQPIERYVQLSAVGVEGNKLPLVVQPVNQSVKAYANPEKRTIIPNDSGIVGYEEIMFVIVPTQSGDITIPAIRVEWFNTSTGQKEITELPAKTIHVEPDDNIETLPTTNTINNAPLSPKNESDNVSASTVPTPVDSDTSKLSRQSVAESFRTSMKQIWMAFGLFELLMTMIVLAVLGFLTFLAQKRQKKRYLYRDDLSENKHKNKKPLPDLYPFE